MEARDWHCASSIALRFILWDRFLTGPAPHQYSKTASVSPELLAFCVGAEDLNSGPLVSSASFFFFSVLDWAIAPALWPFCIYYCKTRGWGWGSWYEGAEDSDNQNIEAITKGFSDHDFPSHISRFRLYPSGDVILSEGKGLWIEEVAVPNRCHQKIQGFSLSAPCYRRVPSQPGWPDWPQFPVFKFTESSHLVNSNIADSSLGLSSAPPHR